MPADERPELHPIWDKVGECLRLPNARRFNPLAAMLRPGALDVGSLFNETCSYWASQFRTDANPIAAPVDFSSLYVALPPNPSHDLGYRLTIGVAACLMNAALDLQPTKPPGAASEMIDLNGVPGAVIPSGSYLLWGVEGSAKARFQVPVLHRIEQPVALATSLVTNALYRQFLTDEGDVALPAPAPDGTSWQRINGIPAFDPPAAADRPAVGVAPKDAARFCAWFSRFQLPQGEQPADVFLVSSLEFRVALSGRFLWRRWDGAHYGLADLSHEQHTRDQGLPEDARFALEGSAAQSHYVVAGGRSAAAGMGWRDAKRFALAYPADVHEFSAAKLPFHANGPSASLAGLWTSGSRRKASFR